MSGGAVRNVMPLHPSLLSCNREELYGKLLRSGGAAVDLKSRLMGFGREGWEDCFLLRNPMYDVRCNAPAERHARRGSLGASNGNVKEGRKKSGK